MRWSSFTEIIAACYTILKETRDKAIFHIHNFCITKDARIKDTFTFLFYIDRGTNPSEKDFPAAVEVMWHLKIAS